MSNLRRSCGIHSNNSVTTEGELQSTISSKKTFITLQENVQVIENRHVRHNPYTNEYIAKRRKLTKKYHQLRLQNGDHKYDDVWVGDEMDTGRAKHNVRFWMQNVHGLVQGNKIDNNILFYVGGTYDPASLVSQARVIKKIKNRLLDSYSRRLY